MSASRGRQSKPLASSFQPCRRIWLAWTRGRGEGGGGEIAEVGPWYDSERRSLIFQKFQRQPRIPSATRTPGGGLAQGGTAGGMTETRVGLQASNEIPLPCATALRRTRLAGGTRFSFCLGR